MELILFSITCLGLLLAHWFLTQPQRDVKLLASITPEEADKIEAIISGDCLDDLIEALNWAFQEEEGGPFNLQKSRFNDHEVWVVYYLTDDAVVINGLAYQKEGVWHLAPAYFLRPRVGLLLSRKIYETCWS